MRYDLVIAGGGVAGAALAAAMSRVQARVLVVERERVFRDRVRGEGMHPWGVAEAERLGLADRLRERCAREARCWNVHVGPQTFQRDLIETSPARLPGLNLHHPELQETLLEAAAEAGAEVVRDARVERVTPGERPHCQLVAGEGARTVEARAIAIADGRNSSLRARLDVATFESPSPMRISGLLLAGLPELPNAVELFFAPSFGRVALVFPLPRGRARVYLAEHRSLPTATYSGPAAVPDFVAHALALGVPRAWLEPALAAGPLASFDSHCLGARHPALDGVALIGDAAGHLDPAFGCGLSLALRDARVLSDALCASDDWNAAIHGYATQRSVYYAALLRLERWMTQVLYEVGPEADALRERVMPRLGELGVDLVGAGPDSRTDEATRAALFGA